MSPHLGGFTPEELDAPLWALDELPRSLWLQGVINSVGALPPRLTGLDSLRRSLMEGGLAPGAEWPLPPVSGPFLQKIDELELPRYCREREDVADQVLQSMLWHTDRIIDFLHDMDIAQAVARAVDAFAAEWRATTGEMDELLHVFGALGDTLKAEHWALVRGLLHSEGWQELVRIRRRLEAMPELRAVIQSLGRARQADDFDDRAHPELQVMEKVHGVRIQVRETRMPEVPAETRGVQRSGRIARMLPSEAALLRHPRLRLIWFARHAERSLLTYEDDDRVRETIPVEAPAWRRSTKPQPRRRLELGPMILCVDTSASMQGAAEDVAKATVLEAMRTAAAQMRRCLVYAFSGPGEVVERELGLDQAGISGAVAFLTQSFHGGTDVDEPLGRALARIQEEAWQFADLVIASDGQFAPTPALATRLDGAKRDLGLRVQGVLTADRDTVGMLEACSDILRVKEWRRLSEPDSAKGDRGSLAARYFPGVFAGTGEPARVSGGVIPPDLGD